MRNLSRNYRLADGRMSDAIETVEQCLDEIAALDRKIAAAELFVHSRMEDRDRGVEIDETALYRRRFALRQMKATVKALRQAVADEHRLLQINGRSRAKSRPISADQHAQKMERIRESQRSTELDLTYFKEEVKRRISPEEYAAIWAAVNKQRAAEASS